MGTLSSARRGARRVRPLRAGLPAALCLALLVTCAEPGQRGSYVLEFYPEEVDCSGSTGQCVDAAGETRTPELLRGVAWGSWILSHYRPRGFYLYQEMRLASGGLAVLELDYAPPLQGSPEQGQLHYFETLGGEVVFRAARVTGRIEIPPGRDCACQDGRLELLLRDPGPDEALDTDDDLLRRLRHGQFTRDGTLCREPENAVTGPTLEIRALPCPSWAVDGGEVYVSQGPESEMQFADHGWGCGGTYQDDGFLEGEGEDEPGWEEDDSQGCGSDDPSPEAGEDPEGCTSQDEPGEEADTSGCGSSDTASSSAEDSGYDDGSGCVESDEPDSSEDTSGCSSGDSSDSSSGDSGGCESSSSSDGYDSSGSSGGCDSSSSSSSSSGGDSCSSTAEAALPPVRAARPRRARRGPRQLSLRLVFLALGAVVLRRALGARQRRTRVRTRAAGERAGDGGGGAV